VKHQRISRRWSGACTLGEKLGNSLRSGSRIVAKSLIEHAEINAPKSPRV